MFIYLLATILIEIPIYFLFNQQRVTYTITILVLANCATWSILHLLLFNTNLNLYLLEMGVTLTEAIIIRLFLLNNFRQSLLISLVQNGITTLIGVIIRLNT